MPFGKSNLKEIQAIDITNLEKDGVKVVALKAPQCGYQAETRSTPTMNAWENNQD